MTTQEKAAHILDRAKELATQARSWVEFSNKLFDQEKGLVAKAFPRMKERRAFYETSEYEEVNQILLALIKRFGVAGGSTPSKSGKFLLRMPKTLHTVLEVEADEEGISLNQLALTKLSVGLGASTSLTTKLIEQAFRQVYDGYSTDWIIVHPDYNAKFLKVCHNLGLTEQSDYQLNHDLQDIRKSGKGSLPPATKKPQFRDYDEYEFAAEIAFRHIQRQYSVSLDRVLCDPEIRDKYDEIAIRLAPSQSVLKLRCAALYLRKTHRLSPKNRASLKCDFEFAGPLRKVNVSSLPATSGMYVFYEKVRPIFAGETELLRRRIDLHLGSSEHLGLPRWLELGCEGDLELKFATLPSVSKEDRLKWLNHFINREAPLLNYQSSKGSSK